MKKIKLIKCTTVALTAGLTVNAHGEILPNILNEDIFTRSSISIVVPSSVVDLDPNNNSIDEKLSIVLKSYGVTFDQHSEIEYHEENSHINLNCFNCIIRVHNDENTNAMSDNKSGGDRRGD